MVQIVAAPTPEELNRSYRRGRRKALGTGCSGFAHGRAAASGSQVPAALGRIRENLKADLAEAIAQGRLAIWDVELAADTVIGIWLQVTRGSLERRAGPDLTRQALAAVLRALGAS